MNDIDKNNPIAEALKELDEQDRKIRNGIKINHERYLFTFFQSFDKGVLEWFYVDQFDFVDTKGIFNIN